MGTCGSKIIGSQRQATYVSDQSQLVFASIGMLADFTLPAYVIGPVVSCSIEFWMMSVLVPIGMGKYT